MQPARLWPAGRRRILFISRSRARCNNADHNGTAAKERFSFPAHGRDATSRRRLHLAYKRFSFPAHGRDATISQSAVSRNRRFHFPLTGEMQPRLLLAGAGLVFSFPAHGRDATVDDGAASLVRRVFISRSRARCNYGSLFSMASLTFHFPLTGEMQRAPDVRHQVGHLFSFPAHGRDATRMASGGNARHGLFISRSRARCN